MGEFYNKIYENELVMNQMNHVLELCVIVLEKGIGVWR